jgi:hypothetical protein
MFRSAGADFPKRCITTWSVHLRYNMAATGQFISTMPKSAFDHAAMKRAREVAKSQARLDGRR